MLHRRSARGQVSRRARGHASCQQPSDDRFLMEGRGVSQEHNHDSHGPGASAEPTEHRTGTERSAGMSLGRSEQTAPTPAGHHGAHLVHQGHHADDFQRRFWICLLLTVPILAYSPLVQDWLRFSPPSFPGSQFVPLVLATAVYAYGGGVFLQGARSELAALTPGMMTLVSLAISVAYAYSVASEFVMTGTALYWEMATLVDVMLLGHWVELRAVGRARGAVAELAKLLPDRAERVEHDAVQIVPITALKSGDLVLVRPGGRVPADGKVEDGHSSIDEAMLTGESRPVSKGPGDRVIAGTVNGEGSLRVRVTGVGSDTALARIMRIVEQAQMSRSRAQALADRAAYWLTLVAIGAGAMTFLAWSLFAGSPGFGLERTVTVLVIACPHALGLAIPLVIAISTTLAAHNGLLVRERLALEQARNLDLVVFDKTGTLTRGQQGVVGVVAVEGLSDDEALALAAAVEGDSEHAIARGIRAEARPRGVRIPTATAFQALPGRGAKAQVGKQAVMVGGLRLLDSQGETVPKVIAAAAQNWSQEGKTVVYVLVGGQIKAAIALADVIRDESRAAVAELKRMGIQVAMLTGDSKAVANWVARELGIEEYFAEVLPEHKADKIRELRQRGQRVAMVGDGINDAPALLTADVGIAIGAGTDVAIESAGIVLIKNDPRDVVRVVRLSRASYRKMVENLAWATGYNVVAIPLAAGILAPIGITLAPAVGALLMSASTVVVAINAQTLRGIALEKSA